MIRFNEKKRSLTALLITAAIGLLAGVAHAQQTSFQNAEVYNAKGDKHFANVHVNYDAKTCKFSDSFEPIELTGTARWTDEDMTDLECVASNGSAIFEIRRYVPVLPPDTVEFKAVMRDSRYDGRELKWKLTSAY